MTPTERREAYVDRGYQNRHEYLLGLAEEYELDEQTVRLAAHVLGPDEDFDALIVTLERATTEEQDK
jgi:hypothetical protein